MNYQNTTTSTKTFFFPLGLGALLFLLLFLACPATAQKIPQNPNKTDKKGLRQGKWTILFDKDWKPTTDATKMEYYRTIAYKDDKPVGIVKNYYKNGMVQMEATLLADRPQDIKDGVTILYDKKGRKDKKLVYKADKLESETFVDSSSVSALNSKGMKFYKQGEYLEAIPLFEKAKEKVKQDIGTENEDYLAVCNNLASSYINQGKYEQGERIYIETKGIIEKTVGKDNYAYTEVCNNLAFLYDNQGNYTQAEPLYVEAKNIIAQLLGKNHSEYALSCNNLASLYGTQGLYSKALPLHIEAKDTYEKTVGKEHIDYAWVCNNLAGLYDMLGLYAQAEPLYMQSNKIYENTVGKNHPDYASSCNGLAVLYLNQGLYDKAESLLLEAKNIREEILTKEHPHYAMSCNNLARLYKGQGKYPPAEALYIEAKNIKKQLLGAEHPSYATSCNNLASLYHDQKLYTQAEPLYIEAKNIREKKLGKDNADYAASCNNLASLYEEQMFYTQAEPLYVEAKNIWEKTLGKQHLNYANSCANLAVLYTKQAKLSQAELLFLESNNALISQIEKNFANLSEKEKASFYATFSNNFEIFTNFSAKYYTQKPQISTEAYNNTLVTKALLFNSYNKVRDSILNGKDENLKKMFSNWIDKKEYLINIYQMSLAKREKQGIDIGKLEAEANDIEKQLSAQSGAFADANNKKRYTWQDIQKELKAGEAAIELIHFRHYNKDWTDTIKYMALIVKPNSTYPEMVVLNNGKDLENKYTTHYKDCITAQKQDKLSYAQYWKPIADKLRGTKKVYLSLDGVYNSISLNTLFNTSTGKYLGDELEIHLLGNTKDLCLPKKTIAQDKKTAVLMGNPAYNEDAEGIVIDTTNAYIKALGIFEKGNVKELTNTKEEVEFTSNLCKKQSIKAQQFVGKEASEDNIKKIKNPTILHIATHGFYLKAMEGEFMGIGSKKLSENPLLRTGLLCSNAKKAFVNGGDGVLTAYEAMNLNLDDTDLVVLAACQTGLGEKRDGEGVYSLQRAFQQAGARTVIMSLWNVPIDATKMLMLTFYEHLLVHKQPKRVAFQKAQNALKGVYPAPYYWGGFVMVGE